MKLYAVLDKQSGAEMYQYRSEAPVEWADWPFDRYMHSEVVPFARPPRTTPVYLGRRQITHKELRDLFTVEEQWDIDKFEASFESLYPESTPGDIEIKNRIRTGLKSYYAATFVDLDNDEVGLLLGVFVGLQLIAVNRIEEILNG